MVDEAKSRLAVEGVASADRALRVLSTFRKSGRALSHAKLAAHTGETAAFYARRGEQRLCLFCANSPHLLRMHLRVGGALPLEDPAIAQVLRAYAPRPLPA